MPREEEITTSLTFSFEEFDSYWCLVINRIGHGFHITVGSKAKAKVNDKIPWKLTTSKVTDWNILRKKWPLTRNSLFWLELLQIWTIKHHSLGPNLIKNRSSCNYIIWTQQIWLQYQKTVTFGWNEQQAAWLARLLHCRKIFIYNLPLWRY